MCYEEPKFFWESESSWKRDHTIEETHADDPRDQEGSLCQQD